MDSSIWLCLGARVAWLIAVASIFTSDSLSENGEVAIIYIGDAVATSDPGYDKFVRAMKSQHPDLMPKIAIRYFGVSPGDPEGYRARINTLAKTRPALFVAPNGDAAAAAIPNIGAIPVVFSCYNDPVRAGLVTSLRMPGSHATGISLTDSLDAKRLEILHEAVPNARSVAVLADRYWSEDGHEETVMANLARRYSMDVTYVYAESADELDALMRSARASTFDAWYVPPTYVAYVSEAMLIGHLARLGKPAIFSTTEDVSRGAPMAYSQDSSFVWRTLADLVARVVAGEDPGSIPIERPRRYLLSVRMGADASKTSIAPSVIRRADRIY